MTETRTHATNSASRRRFRALWPFLAPFASLLLASVLRAIKEQAERTATSDTVERKA